VDGDWSTSFFWKSSLDSFGVSFAEISWEIPSDAPQGIYRVCHFGTRKTIFASFESMALYIPDWWLLDGLGSIAAGVLVQAAKLVYAVSENVRWAFSGLDLSHTKDFSGCSRSFLVHGST
jgi:neutral ceramidase